MIKAETYSKRSKRDIALLALSLFMLMSAFLFLLAPKGQVYASEVDQAQVSERYSYDVLENDETPGYHVYSYGYEGNDVAHVQPNSSDLVITDLIVPLAGPTSSSIGQWSLFNMIMVLVCLVSTIAMFLAMRIRKTKDFRVIVARTLAGAFGMITIAAWFLLGTLEAWTTLFTGSTYVIGALFVIYVALVVGSYIYEAKLNKEGNKSYSI